MQCTSVHMKWKHYKQNYNTQTDLKILKSNHVRANKAQIDISSTEIAFNYTGLNYANTRNLQDSCLIEKCQFCNFMQMKSISLRTPRLIRELSYILQI